MRPSLCGQYRKTYMSLNCVWQLPYKNDLIMVGVHKIWQTHILRDLQHVPIFREHGYIIIFIYSAKRKRRKKIEKNNYMATVFIFRNAFSIQSVSHLIIFLFKNKT